MDHESYLFVAKLSKPPTDNLKIFILSKREEKLLILNNIQNLESSLKGQMCSSRSLREWNDWQPLISNLLGDYLTIRKSNTSGFIRIMRL